MLRDRILSTLKFFDLQDYPLTLLELHSFLLADTSELKELINTQWDLIPGEYVFDAKIQIDEIANCLAEECNGEVEQKEGFYCLAGRINIIDQRLQNYFYGIKREQRIKKFVKGLKYLPFVRGAALAGSQAMGQQKASSDIDLLIILEPKFLWLGRTLVTAYFQTFGIRRYGKKIANRFCLNHYLGGAKKISEFRNLYTAWEYMKLRPLVGSGAVLEFQKKNSFWISVFFPNFELDLIYNSHPYLPQPPRSATAEHPSSDKEGKLRGNSDGGLSSAQGFFERMLVGKLGQWLEVKLKNWQLPKIRREEFILVLEDELSFHPQSKQQELLARFFAA